jgi:hypothetical protein
MVFATSVIADEVVIVYLDENSETQTLTIDVNSSDADNALAATLILEDVKTHILEGVNKFTVILDGKEDLQIIADAVAAKAPDNATAIAVRNTILGVSPFPGGRSIERTAQQPDASPAPVATPPYLFESHCFHSVATNQGYEK